MLLEQQKALSAFEERPLDLERQALPGSRQDAPLPRPGHLLPLLPE